MPELEVGSAVVMAPAQTTWDYEVISIHARHNDVLQDKLTERGREGWELVFITMPLPNEYQCVFRRPSR